MDSRSTALSPRGHDLVSLPLGGGSFVQANGAAGSHGSGGVCASVSAKGEVGTVTRSPVATLSPRGPDLQSSTPFRGQNPTRSLNGHSNGQHSEGPRTVRPPYPGAPSGRQSDQAHSSRSVSQTRTVPGGSRVAPQLQRMATPPLPLNQHCLGHGSSKALRSSRGASPSDAWHARSHAGAHSRAASAPRTDPPGSEQRSSNLRTTSQSMATATPPLPLNQQCHGHGSSKALRSSRVASPSDPWQPGGHAGAQPRAASAPRADPPGSGQRATSVRTSTHAMPTPSPSHSYLHPPSSPPVRQSQGQPPSTPATASSPPGAPSPAGSTPGASPWAFPTTPFRGSSQTPAPGSGKVGAVGPRAASGGSHRLSSPAGLADIGRRADSSAAGRGRSPPQRAHGAVPPGPNSARQPRACTPSALLKGISQGIPAMVGGHRNNFLGNAVSSRTYQA